MGFGDPGPEQAVDAIKTFVVGFRPQLLENLQAGVTTGFDYIKGIPRPAGNGQRIVEPTLGADGRLDFVVERVTFLSRIAVVGLDTVDLQQHLRGVERIRRRQFAALAEVTLTEHRLNLFTGRVLPCHQRVSFCADGLSQSNFLSDKCGKSSETKFSMASRALSVGPCRWGSHRCTGTRAVAASR